MSMPHPIGPIRSISNTSTSGLSSSMYSSSPPLTGLKEQQYYEKLSQELAAINQQLSEISKNKMKSEGEVEIELRLLENRIITLLKCKRWNDVIEEGYRILGKKGPSVCIYKCILISLCRIEKFEHDVAELFTVWHKTTPNCPQMQETKQKMNSLYNAIKSGNFTSTDLFRNLESILGIHSEGVGSNENNEQYHWRFRPPPKYEVTFYLCPRGTISACMYGEKCIAAHSIEELEEWKVRQDIKKWSNTADDILKVKTSELSLNKAKLLPPIAFHYLVELTEKVKETADIRSLLVDELPNVKFVCQIPLKITIPLVLDQVGKTSSGAVANWPFVVSSRVPIRTICLLNDMHREYFSIVSGKFFDSSKKNMNLINIHEVNFLQAENGGIQVLNTFTPLPLLQQLTGGWPDWFFYKIEVIFKQPQQMYGSFFQTILFDCKSDPKMVKHLSVEVVPEEPPKVGISTSTDDYNLEVSKQRRYFENSNSAFNFLPSGPLTNIHDQDILLPIFNVPLPPNIPVDIPKPISNNFSEATSADFLPSLFQQNLNIYTKPSRSKQENEHFIAASGSRPIPTDSPSASSSSSSTTDINPLNSFDSNDFPSLQTNSTKNGASGWVEVKNCKKTKLNKSPEVDNANKDKLLTADLKIGYLQEMGFEKRKIIKALQHCDKDLGKSIEWLLNGQGGGKPGRKLPNKPNTNWNTKL